MAAKAGDDPHSLMTLATVFCLRNLRKTMCYQGFRNKLCLRSDVFLPSEICDKLVTAYVPGHMTGPVSCVMCLIAPALLSQVHGAGPHRQQL